MGLSILESLNLRPRKLEIVSCPSCGRAQVDVYKLADEVTAGLEGMEVPLRVAVMGCVVNGPGEARDADLGVASGNGKGQIFVKGEVIKTVPEAQIVETLIEEAMRLADEAGEGELAGGQAGGAPTVTVGYASCVRPCQVTDARASRARRWPVMSTFDDLDAFVATRRQAGLALSPDGARLVTTVSELSPDATKYVSSIWELDPTGEAPRPAADAVVDGGVGGGVRARRRPAVHLPPPRPHRRAAATTSPPRSGSCPHHGGEARQVLEPGRRRRVLPGRPRLGPRRRRHHRPGRPGAGARGRPRRRRGRRFDDAAGALRAARKKAGVSARLHDRFPVRFWDHDLGPGRPQLRVHDPLAADRLTDPLAVADPSEPTQRLRESRDQPRRDPARRRRRRPGPGRPGRRPRAPGAAADRDGDAGADGATEIVADEPGADHEMPVITPDGRWLLWIRERARRARPGAGADAAWRARSTAARRGPSSTTGRLGDPVGGRRRRAATPCSSSPTSRATRRCSGCRSSTAPSRG